VGYARKLGECHLSLDDLPGVKSKSYRDTSGVDVEEFKQIISTIDRDGPIGIRDYAIMRLLWDNVLRRKEICGLNVRDFDRTGKLYILGKGDLEQTAIDLTDGAIAAIVDWLAVGKTGGADSPLFISLSHNKPGHRLSGTGLYSIVRAYSAAAGIAKVMSPHRVRHSGITAALDATNGDTRRVQQLSRHANLNTLTLYDDNRQHHQGVISKVLGDLLDI
jgi:integrase/recombinase XerC